jgi:hypothetical protein
MNHIIIIITLIIIIIIATIITIIIITVIIIIKMITVIIVRLRSGPSLPVVSPVYSQLVR